MRKQEIPLIFLILQITVMMSPENYCRIMVAGFMVTSLLIINLNLLKIQKLSLNHGHEQDFRVLTITWSIG